MSHKLLPRLGSAIASTILSYAALSLAGVDKAQAAVLTYNFRVENAGTSGFFKFNNSSLTGIGVENIAVSEGRLDTFNLTSYFGAQAKEYYDLAGFKVLFYQGDFRGLQASGGEYFSPNVQGEPYPFMYTGSASWSMATNGLAYDMWTSYFQGYKEVIYQGRFIVDRAIVRDTPVSYTLVNTEPEPVGEPVPEPLTAGGTALALAGLSWLKHKKKMAA
jgi:hypothetical protein